MKKTRICKKCQEVFGYRKQLCENCGHNKYSLEESDEKTERKKPQEKICTMCGYLHEGKTVKEKSECLKCGQTYVPGGGMMDYGNLDFSKALKEFDKILESRQTQIFVPEQTAKDFLDMNRTFLDKAEVNIETTKSEQKKVIEREKKRVIECEKKETIERERKEKNALEFANIENKKRKKMELDKSIEDSEKQNNLFEKGLKVNNNQLKIIDRILKYASKIEPSEVDKLDNKMLEKIMNSEKKEYWILLSLKIQSLEWLLEQQ